MPNGYAGNILHVDLSSGRLTVEHPPERFYRKYLGGSAMGLYYLLTEMKPGAEALGPDNVFTVMLAPTTGAAISGNSRATVNARSPLVDGVGDSQMGGFFPAEMKFAGYDGVVVTGRAEKPVYLWLSENTAELRDAAHLWGHTTSEVETLLKAELGDNQIEIAQCGPAGEKLVRLASVINMANRAAGRTGMGAVMGSKNLKAIVARGKSKRLPIAHPQRLNALAKAGPAALPSNPDMVGLKEHGTAGVLSYQNATGGLPTNNYTEGQFAGADAISGEVMTETILRARETCYACTVRCKRVVETAWQGRPVEKKHGGPEYETLATFGAYCGVDDLAAVSYANKLCNEYGLDTIGTGATVAWAMECFEKGLLSEAEIGFPARFGDAAAMVRLLELLATREGIGHALAEGSRRAADRLEVGHDHLITVKGSEAPAHMPQAKRSLGLIYAVNPFGADHQSSEHDPMVEDGAATDFYMERLKLIGIPHTLAPRSLDAGKVAFALKTQHFYSFTDSADLCQFVFGPAWTLYGPAEAVELIQAVTGWADFDLDELMLVGERRLNLMRLFNAREGLTRADDKLPKKFFKTLAGTGPTANANARLTEAELQDAQDIYYELSGWDAVSGNPTLSTLERLGLEWAAGVAAAGGQQVGV